MPVESRTSRQWGALECIARRVDEQPEFLALLLLGSLAADGGDEVSDIDLFVVVNEFEWAWEMRAELHGADVLRTSSKRREDMPSTGGYSWLTSDLVMVEALLTTTDSGARLAAPYRVVTGPPDMAARLPRRRRIERAEMRGSDDPLERAYDALKAIVRNHERI